MWDFIVLQPTFNRSEVIIQTVLYLQEDANHHDFKLLHVLFDDCSIEPHTSALNNINETVSASTQYQIHVERCYPNRGRLEHWKLVNEMFCFLKPLEFKYAIILADDMRPCKGFLTRVARHFEFLRKQNDAYVAMTLLSSFPMLWGSHSYIDGHYIAIREFFDFLDWNIREVLFPNPLIPSSSGVHKQIVSRFKDRQAPKIAPAPGISYVEPIDVPSVMFPKDQFPARPQQISWVQDNFIDRWWYENRDTNELCKMQA